MLPCACSSPGWISSAGPATLLPLCASPGPVPVALYVCPRLLFSEFFFFSRGLFVVAYRHAWGLVRPPPRLIVLSGRWRLFGPRESAPSSVGVNHLCGSLCAVLFGGGSRGGECACANSFPCAMQPLETWCPDKVWYPWSAQRSAALVLITCTVNSEHLFKKGSTRLVTFAAQGRGTFATSRSRAPRPRTPFALCTGWPDQSHGFKLRPEAWNGRKVAWVGAGLLRVQEFGGLATECAQSIFFVHVHVHQRFPHAMRHSSHWDVRR